MFFHVGAANYRSYVWANGQKVCEHEGGFTPLDCEVTSRLKDGGNFIVMAVDNTRLPDGIPTLQTDWWNYGGLTRDVSLVEVPEQFIDDFDLHLKRGTQTVIEGWVHVEGATPEAQTTVSIPELNVNEAAKVGTDGPATFQFETTKLEPWSPEHPRLYRVHIHAGHDDLEDEMGFRTVEVRGTQIGRSGRGSQDVAGPDCSGRSGDGRPEKSGEYFERYERVGRWDDRRELCSRGLDVRGSAAANPIRWPGRRSRPGGTKSSLAIAPDGKPTAGGSAGEQTDGGVQEAESPQTRPMSADEARGFGPDGNGGSDDQPYTPSSGDKVT